MGWRLLKLNMSRLDPASASPPGPSLLSPVLVGSITHHPAVQVGNAVS